MQDLKARQALLEQKRQEQQEKKAEIRRKPKKHNIKRPLSAYMRFSVERRKEIVEKDPKMKHPSCFKEIAQKISQEWKVLNAKRKKELEAEAAADLAKYKRKVADWKEKHAPKRRKKGRRAPSRASAAGSAAAGKGKGGKKELQQELDSKVEGEEAQEAANTVTDVPESCDEISNNSRQSSTAEADANKTMDEPTLAAEAAVASTAA
ncbi:hypothetical protein Emed_007480 [Eimeria media]